MFAILKRDFKAYFQGVIGWLFVAVMLAAFGLYFYVINLNSGYPYLSYTLSQIIIILMVIIPMLTMRSFSEERKNKTEQLLLTSPVSVGKIVMGKYLAICLIYSIDIVLFCVFPLILSVFGTVGIGESYISILGIWLLGCACIAIGIYISSRTENQIIAAVITFGIIFLSYLSSGIIGIVFSEENYITKILSVFDLFTPFSSFVSGCLNISSIIYYLSAIAIFLILTRESINKRRWSKTEKRVRKGLLSTGFVTISMVFIVGINILTGLLPENVKSLDCSSTNLYEIEDKTKEIVEGLKEDITIYVLADENNKDATLNETIERYKGLSKKIKVKYINPTNNPSFYEKYSDEELANNSLIVESDKRSSVIDYSDIYETQIDYSTYQTTVTGYDAQGQITSAIEYVTMEDDKLPVVYEITGHDELDIGDNFKKVVKKCNIELGDLDLLKCESVPKDAKAIIINSPAKDFSDDETKMIKSYLKSGGEAIITGVYTAGKLENFDSILEDYGVNFENGIVCENDGNHNYQNNSLYMLPKIEEDELTQNVSDGYIFFAGAMSIKYDSENEDVSYSPLFTTSKSSVLKKDWQNIKDSEYEEGDIKGPFTLGLKVQPIDKDSTTQLMVFASPYVFADDYDEVVRGTNSMFFGDMVSELAGNVELSSSAIPVKDYQLGVIAVNSITAVTLGVITMIFIPGLMIFGGVVIWSVRRKK